MKLSNDDKVAIDLILDRTLTPMQSMSSTQTAAAGHVNAVQTLVGLLNSFKVEEPPLDLVARTLARIDQSVNTTGAIAADHPVARVAASQQMS